VTSARENTLLLLALALASACRDNEQAPTSAPRERSQAVQAAAPEAAPGARIAAAPAASPVAAAPAPSKPRRGLCPHSSRDGKPLPKKRISQVVLGDGKPLVEGLSRGSGAYTWVNFWAAWCAPCKEEIPRLVGWERELAKAGKPFHLAFVSIDDDERQLRQFLEASSELRATYWLREGKERDEWMKAAGLDADPELPIHLLVDPQGRIACKVQGAVEDADLPELRRLVAGPTSD
jgi:thiol-disulfide isomerase/thioredoxin